MQHDQAPHDLSLRASDDNPHEPVLPWFARILTFLANPPPAPFEERPPVGPMTAAEGERFEAQR